MLLDARLGVDRMMIETTIGPLYAVFVELISVAASAATASALSSAQHNPRGPDSNAVDELLVGTNVGLSRSDYFPACRK